MSDATLDPRYGRKPPKRPIKLSWADERVRGIVWQIVVVGIVGSAPADAALTWAVRLAVFFAAIWWSVRGASGLG